MLQRRVVFLNSLSEDSGLYRLYSKLLVREDWLLLVRFCKSLICWYRPNARGHSGSSVWKMTQLPFYCTVLPAEQCWGQRHHRSQCVYVTSWLFCEAWGDRSYYSVAVTSGVIYLLAACFLGMAWSASLSLLSSSSATLRCAKTFIFRVTFWIANRFLIKCHFSQICAVDTEVYFAFATAFWCSFRIVWWPEF